MVTLVVATSKAGVESGRKGEKSEKVEWSTAPGCRGQEGTQSEPELEPEPYKSEYSDTVRHQHHQ